MSKKHYYQQNDGHLANDPPEYLGQYAKATWRKVVPFLESTERVKRIDSNLVEQYCTQYEIYRYAYADVQRNGIQSKIFSSLQDSSGKIVGEDFIGFRKNPAVGIMNDANKQLNAVGIQLGLTPKGRQELMELVSQKKEKSVEQLMKESNMV